MIIKDSTFFDEIRDPTEARVFLVKPLFTELSCTVSGLTATTYFNGGSPTPGKFEYGEFTEGNPAPGYILSAGALQEDDVSITVNATNLCTNQTCYLCVVFGSDRNGKCTRPDASLQKVHFYECQTDEIGFLDRTIGWGPTEDALYIESINLVDFIEVDQDDIKSMTFTDKNDIVLSAIPQKKLDIELCDDNKTYLSFIQNAGKDLRVMHYYQYNDVFSDVTITYLDEMPTLDTNTTPKTLACSFVGITGVMNAMCRNTSDGDGDAPYFRKDIGESGENPSYLQMLQEAFNTDVRKMGLYYASSKISSCIGGTPLKILSYFNSSPIRYTDTPFESLLSKAHYTMTPVDGYTYADAVRLLMNAQGHWMAVKNETIVGYRRRGGFPSKNNAMFVSFERYNNPIKTAYDTIGLVKFPMQHYETDEAEVIGSFEIDLSNPDYVEMRFANPKDIYIRIKSMILEKSYSGHPGDFTWSLDYTDSTLTAADFGIIHKGATISIEWPEEKDAATVSGKAVITLTGKPYKKVDDGTFLAKKSESNVVLELNNPFMRPRADGAVYDIQEQYAAENYMNQSGRAIYEFDGRSRFDIAALDGVIFQTDDGVLHLGTVIEHILSNAGLRSQFRVIDEEIIGAILCGSSMAVCSNLTICTEEI